MAFEIKVNAPGVTIYTCLSTDTKKTTVPAGSFCFETDTLLKFEFRGTWVQISTTTSDGSTAGLVVVDNARFKLSSYSAELTVTTGGITVARATGTTAGILKNYGATNYLKYGFGEDAAAALVNAALGPRVLAGEIVHPDDLEWPANMTHMGLIADTASVTAYLGKGN